MKTWFNWYRPAFLRLRGYTFADLGHDAGAGIIVGVVALPLCIGLAIACGATPQQGLCAGIIGGLVVSLFGGSRYQVGGPAGAFVGLCSAGMAQFGPEGLALASLIAGFLILGLAFARLGNAISFIPVPVVIGFTTGIAVIIASTQIGPALGLPPPSRSPEHFHQTLRHIITHLQDAHWIPLLVCAATIVMVIVGRRWSAKFPAALAALVVVTAASVVFKLDIATVGSSFTAFDGGLPAPHLPGTGIVRDALQGDDASIIRLKGIVNLAIAIAILGSIESLLSAVVADGLGNDRHDSNSELLGQGLANIATALFAGLPCTGVIARTSTNIRAGARSPVAGVIHALVLLASLLFLAPLVSLIPLAALAGILFTVCWYMAELRHWPHILHGGRSDAFLLPLAFGLTVFVDLTWAISIGSLLAMLFFVKRISEATQLAEIPRDEHSVEPPKGCLVYEIRGPFFFGSATLLRDLEGGEADAKVLILRLAQVPFIDATAAFSLRELFSSYAQRGGQVLTCDLLPKVREDLERFGFAKLMPEGALHDDLGSSLRRAQDLILK